MNQYSYIDFKFEQGKPFSAGGCSLGDSAEVGRAAGGGI